MPKNGCLIRNFDWVEARVSNYDEMAKFYTETLGLTLEMEEEDKDFGEFEIAGSKTFLALLDV